MRRDASLRTRTAPSTRRLCSTTVDSSGGQARLYRQRQVAPRLPIGYSNPGQQHLESAMASGADPTRGASQPATDASPTPGTSQAPRSASLLELAEEHDKPSHVSLVGAVDGERWCLPGVGKSADFMVPVRTFLAEYILAKCLVKLTRQQEGWAPLRDEATGQLV